MFGVEFVRTDVRDAVQVDPNRLSRRRVELKESRDAHRQLIRQWNVQPQQRHGHIDCLDRRQIVVAIVFAFEDVIEDVGRTMIR